MRASLCTSYFVYITMRFAFQVFFFEFEKIHLDSISPTQTYFIHSGEFFQKFYIYVTFPIRSISFVFSKIPILSISTFDPLKIPIFTYYIYYPFLARLIYYMYKCYQRIINIYVPFYSFLFFRIDFFILDFDKIDFFGVVSL